LLSKTATAHVIATYNAADLFHWGVIISKHNPPRAQWYICHILGLSTITRKWKWFFVNVSERNSPTSAVPGFWNVCQDGGYARGIFLYLLTPWSRVLLEKLTGSQLIKKLPTFYGTRRFITAFTNACYLSLSLASSIQSIPHIPLP
jgi:hypothetical protein